MSREYFPGIEKIQYVGPDARDMFAFTHYDEDRIVMGKTMKDHFRFAVAYWHSFCNLGVDPFGAPTRQLPWNTATDPFERAKDKMDAAFEFMTKLGVPYYCFHDVDLIDDGPTLDETRQRIERITDYALEKQASTGIKLLWGTANLFTDARYMNGAATNPDFHVLAYAGSAVKTALDATCKLGGENFVFWGGREGYLSLLNTDMKREKDHLAMFFRKARDYARDAGFEGTLLIEPKPMEPSKHQYDFDVATCIAFLREYDLLGDYKLNIEVNHATLASHTFEHELQVAADSGVLGSIDANRGDYQNGWDTDQFPVDVYELTQAMLVLLEAGGLTTGGINFDAKVRRNSTDLEDLFVGHITGMDAFARALLAAEEILESSDFREMRKSRYASFDSGPGAEFEKGKLSLSELDMIARQMREPVQVSGMQEKYERLVSMYV